MTYVREQLCQRLARQPRRAWRRWLHPASGRRSGDRFLWQQTCLGHSVRGGHRPTGHRRPDTVTAPPAPADTLDTAAAVRLAAPGHGRRLRRTPRADTPATALRNTAAVRAPACDRVRPACRNQHGCGLR
jgi:hypothetical protein